MLDSLEKGLYWLASFMVEGDSDAHCQIRAPMSDDTLVLTNDDLMSIIEIKGSRKLIGAAEFEDAAANMAKQMANVMKSSNGRQHSFAIGYRSSPESAPRLLKEILGPSLRTAQRLGVTCDDYFVDQMGALAKKCNETSVYMILYTHRSGLSIADSKRSSEWREEAGAKFAKATPGSKTSDDFNQSPRTPAPALVPRHSAALANLVSDLNMDIEKGGGGLLVDVLDVGPALTMMRRHLDASNFESSWRARLLGAKSSVVPAPANRPGEASNMFPMRIGRQLITEPSAEIFGDAEISKRGGIYYASVILEIPPDEGSLPFAALSERIGREIPWTVNIEMVPNGEKLRKADQFYAGFMGAFGEYNKRVKAGWKELRDLKNSGQYIAAIRVTFSTWAKTETQVVENLSFLKSSLESWGSCVVTNETGSPGLASLCSAAGFSKRMPAPYIPGPIEELTRMLPMSMPASVWDAGQLVTHTKEGRPYPVGFGTTAQPFWGTLIFAPPGYGKSFLMNMINYGILTSPGLEELPYLTVVDVGPSSRLVLDMFRAMLPKHMARQIVSLRIRNSPDFTVNPLDTQHGCDRPTDIDKDFQVSVVSTLCPSLGLEGEKFIAMVITEAYRMLGRSSPSQRTWQAALDETVSAALAEIGYPCTDKTRVWEVVDALFKVGRIEDSALAQRYAMPRLVDLVKASRATEILNSWGTAPTPSGELIIDVFTRNIQSSLSEYELISGFTKFEINGAKVISIDLEEVVTGTDSEEGKRRAALMFLFGRRLGARNYFLRWAEIESMVPEMYREYQFARVSKMEEALKFLEYDEVHYASGIPSMAKRIQEDLRVGRKYKCVTMMASQLLNDFPPAAVDNCYTYFIMGAGTDTSVDQLRKTFGLSASETYAIQTECTGPGKMFALFKTVKGTTSQVLHTTTGPFQRWAFSTSKDDALLRASLEKELGGEPITALRELAIEFPSGSARDEMERYKRGKGVIATGETITEVFTRRVLDGMMKRSRQKLAA